MTIPYPAKIERVMQLVATCLRFFGSVRFGRQVKLSGVSHSGFVRLKKASALLLGIVFLFYFTSINFFPHTHTIGNKIIAHSHPFANSQHSHTDGAIAIIADISIYFATGISILGSLGVFRRFLNNIVIPCRRYHDAPIGIWNFQRGPPLSD